ncbi:MAG: tol-pal system protein YbgF [Pseudomonadota bacterium]
MIYRADSAVNSAFESIDIGNRSMRVFRSVWRAAVATALLLTVSACSSVLPLPEPEPEPVVVTPEPEPQPQQNLEFLKALSDLQDLESELRELRNLIEKMQFESDNARRRQQDLFADIDRRLLDLEKNRSAVAVPDASQSSVASGTNATVGGNSLADIVIVGNSNTVESTSPSPTLGGNENSVVSVNEQQQYEQAFELLKQSRYEDAINAFQAMVDTWPESQLADDGYYWMSEAHYVNREFESALTGFTTVVNRYPDSQRVPEALLKIGYIQYDIGAYEDAAETFRDVLARFPGHQVTVSAQTRLRRIEQTIQ